MEPSEKHGLGILHNDLKLRWNHLIRWYLQSELQAFTIFKKELSEDYDVCPEFYLYMYNYCSQTEKPT